MSTSDATTVERAIQADPPVGRHGGKIVVGPVEAQAAAVAMTAMSTVGMYEQWFALSATNTCGYREPDMFRTLAAHQTFHQAEADAAEALADAMPRYPEAILRAAWVVVHPPDRVQHRGGVVLPGPLNRLHELCLAWVRGEELPEDGEETSDE